MFAGKVVAWGSTESQRRLDRRWQGINEQHRKLGLSVSNEVYEDLAKMRQNGDEYGLRKEAEEAERAIAICRQAVKAGGTELLHHLIEERKAGRLSDNEEDWNVATSEFKRKKQAELDEAASRAAGDKEAEEEPIRRKQEVEGLKFRIVSLPAEIGVPLLRQLEELPINAKPRDYRSAVYKIEKALRQATI